MIAHPLRTENKSIFKIVSCHEEYFNIFASWNYREAGHGKDPCGPIGGTGKRKALQAVKNDKAVIQDAHDFYKWAKKEEENSAIKFFFFSIDNYERSLFLSEACNGIKSVDGTMKLHAVFPLYSKQIMCEEHFLFMSELF